MRTCKVEITKQQCTCSYEPCSRKGICCECIRYHRESGELPGCVFPEDIERTYDRSIERFVKTFQKRGKWLQ
ncbi:MAG TPA: DUF6485 family protein [Anaerolineae bacterium]|nr:DUF6485 family protein [Anaerolineae bacterium]